MDYNRVVKDLNGLSNEEFLKKVEEKFIIDKVGKLEHISIDRTHSFGMFLDGT